ncbi:hypothetical protein D3C73_1030570 [compost metagenome]
MGDALQSHQADEAARPLDGVHQAEDAGQGRRVARVALEAHQFAVQRLETLARFSDEVA